MDLHARIAKALGWSAADTQRFSLHALRDLVRPVDSQLAADITAHISSGRVVTRKNPNPHIPGGSVTACIKRMTGKARSPGGLCASLARKNPMDDHALTELHLYAENNGELYRQRRIPIEKNLLQKVKKGTYDSALAAKLWLYYVDDAAKRYAKDFDHEKNWSKLFPKTLRMELAKDFAKEFEVALKAGEFDAQLATSKKKSSKKNPAKKASKKTAKRRSIRI